jgi:hypothetical protein
MKYVTGRELPFAKVGTEVRKSLGGETLVVDDPHYPGQVLYIGLACELDELIRFGWIIEVKPREFEGYVLHDGKTFYMLSEIHDRYNAERYEKIKVREVIE